MKNNVKYLRRSQEFNISQDDLAMAVGFSRTSIAALEAGITTPSAELILRIGIFFNKDPREIFKTDHAVMTLREIKEKKKGHSVKV